MKKFLSLNIFVLIMIMIINNAKADNDNWYILLSTSTFYANYRHTANVLSIYWILKSNGIKDDRIILMMGDSFSGDPRNPFPGKIFFTNESNSKSLLNSSVEIDYKDSDLTAMNFLNLLRGRYPKGTPLNKMLLSNEHSKILIYISSHGGDNMFKMQDNVMINSEDMKNAYDEMRAKKMYKEILVIVDSCKGVTQFDAIDTPDIFMVASSSEGEEALSYIFSEILGAFVNDVFTYHLSRLLPKDLKSRPNITIQEFFSQFSYDMLLKATIGFKDNLVTRKSNQILLREYFVKEEVKINSFEINNYESIDNLFN